MNEKIKDYIKIKGKEDLDLLFNVWDETSLEQFQDFADYFGKINMESDDDSVYEFIDNLSFEINKSKLLKEMYTDEQRTKEDLIELLVHCENINNVINMEIEFCGKILDNDVIVMYKQN
ncbi:hypothetical protein [Mammaliicoccus vitulinus]|uniref:hypothetical protein n=1 Tax=Mammaliicoccus vitulinus TaxID=71237 RepID=UPI00248CF429|nr:hypothetical protein [Mammaliicoccus vitulinus]